MAPLTIQHAFELAVQHHQAGRLHEAEQLYRRILARQPDIPEAHFNLGNTLKDKGQLDQAIAAYRQAIALRPRYTEACYNLGNVLADKGQLDEAIAAYRVAIAYGSNIPEAHYNLANALKKKGQIDEAIAAYRQAIALGPNIAEAHSNLGAALKEKGQLNEAIAAYQQAIALRPGYAEARYNLGNARATNGQLDEAIAAYRQAITLSPNIPEAHGNLGNALKDNGRLDEAIAAYRQAIALRPGYAEVYSNLGNVLKDMGQVGEAIAAYRQAIALGPNISDIYSNLGVALKDNGQLDEAIAACQQAIALEPSRAEGHCNLAIALQDTGQLDEAIAAYRQAIAADPGDARFASNLLLALHYHPGYDAGAIAEEHRRWERQHARPLRKFVAAHGNDRDPERRLRIGYVSPDFKDHVVGRFLLPLLEHHDHRRFEVFCYSSVKRPDGMTARLRSCADQWREIARLNDEQAAGLIRADRIDILVDLSGHTAGNRLLVFARKPAPVQVSYLGYPGSSGMSTIDYRLTDRFADPPDLADPLDVETLHRLPQTNWCFAEPEDSPPLEPSSATRGGPVTFGSFNNFAKVTEATLRVWGRILREVPGSRLLLKAAALGSASACERIRRSFAAQGIDVGRVVLCRPLPDHAAHLALYRDMDIALDTFPYHGTATTCDALWMGAAVITLAGQTHVSRVGVSLLNSIGLPELVATTTDEYVRLGVALARDPDRLTALRLGLRERMRKSPLMDAASFTRDMEGAYHQMWRKWCGHDPGEVMRET